MTNAQWHRKGVILSLKLAQWNNALTIQGMNNITKQQKRQLMKDTNLTGEIEDLELEHKELMGDA